MAAHAPPGRRNSSRGRWSGRRSKSKPSSNRDAARLPASGSSGSGGARRASGGSGGVGLKRRPKPLLVRASSMPDLAMTQLEGIGHEGETGEEGEENSGFELSPTDNPAEEPDAEQPALRRLSSSGQLAVLRGAGEHTSVAAGAAREGGLFQSVTARYNMDDSVALGTGGYAVVRRAVRKLDGDEVAIKIMRVGKPQPLSSSSSSSDDDGDDEGEEKEEYKNAALTFQEIMTEIEVVQQLTHDNIVNIHEYFIHRGSCFVVMQLLRGKELMDALLEHGPYTETDVRVMMGSLLDAVAYMHSMGVTHRDLKLENLVLSRPGAPHRSFVHPLSVCEVRG